MPLVHAATQQLGKKDLQYDVHLASCPAVDSKHTAFKLMRNAASSYVLSLARRETNYFKAPYEPLRRAQQMTELELRQQLLAGDRSMASASFPVQMSATPPGPLSRGSPVKIAVLVEATVGTSVPQSQQRRRSGGCAVGILPRDAAPGPWVQSIHRLAMGSIRTAPR